MGLFFSFFSMASVDVSVGRSNVQFEASPDVEVTMVIIKGSKVVDEVSSNINIGKTVAEIKGVIATHFKMNIQYITIWKADVQLEDNKKMMEYDISLDDELEVRYPAEDQSI